MTKVTGSISQKGVRGSLSQLGVIGTIAVLSVVGTLAECGHDNPIPVLQSATIENADPSKIILTYDIALNESYVPGLVNYIIVGVFYISIEVSGNTVIINIDPPAVYGDVVEINYYNNIIDGVALRSEAGVLAASFTSYPVANNVEQTNLINNSYDWVDSNADGLADGWIHSSGTGTPSIVNGGGFIGNAQRFYHIIGVSSVYSYSTGVIAELGATYNITFKYKNNGANWQVFLRNIYDRFESNLAYSAIVNDANYNIVATDSSEIIIRFLKTSGYATTYLDIDELSVVKL